MFFTRLTPLLALIPLYASAQSGSDSSKTENWNLHFQETNVGQYHPAFYAKYSGQNSLSPQAESAITITSTLYFDTRVWKGGEIICNPELSGGAGLSHVLGVAGALNGEAYRVGDPAPAYYIGRIYVRQVFSLGKDSENIDDDLNQLKGKQPTDYLSVNFGKFQLQDFFDANSYSKDPRTDFLNWALITGGAWDYPANTRGYTYGFVIELVHPSWSFRLSGVMVPTVANGPYLDLNILQAHGETAEYGRFYKVNGYKGAFHVIGFFTQAHMGNYDETLADTAYHMDITQTRSYAHTKGGFLITAEQQLNENSGVFSRISWNDGQNESWAYTEIDQSISGGYVIYGKTWDRINDKAGIAFAVDGISKAHEEYLAAGGYGFIIGDGALNYGHEFIVEANYSAQITKNLTLTPDYQFVLNPAYNKDRGPVNVFGLRLHVAF